ncbi:Large-conductance mechanosensitive channel [Kordia antarctica]|uniref:Large-conductance mechanosensitive channel n=1 Tax=Kordia antarctica TaxID=1218801 RepID=A0A7L4ZMC6_9FLAO|nr:large conductance mechanosensitive channel protein MscL [Kordia antarctica]QHI37589.1 Large-conductance mechanosensitive channel [Kordia antarctica]
MFKEFKSFIMTGNVVDLAVAVIMAGAIGAVVKGFVSNIVMPCVGYFTGGTDFADKKIILSDAVVDATGKVITPENAIMWGSWINTIVNLIIVGFVMFMIIKAYNKTKKKEEVPAPAPPPGPTQEELLADIRDLLKKQA